MKLNTVSSRNKRHPANPQAAEEKPQRVQGDKHLKLIQRQIVEVQSKIAELKKLKQKEELVLVLKQSKSHKELPTTIFVEVPTERVVEREIVEEVEVEVEREIVVEQPETHIKVVEIKKEITKEVIVPKKMVRPRDPPEVIIKEVVENKTIVVEVVEPFDEALARQLTTATHRNQQLHTQFDLSMHHLAQLKAENKALGGFG